MSECINHPGKEGLYKCSRCRKNFCLACVELIDDKAYCYDCLKEIVKEVREGGRKYLTVRVVVSSVIALLIALVSMRDAMPLLVYIYQNLLSIPMQPGDVIRENALSFTIGLAFLALSFGLVTTKRWAYRYGMILNVVVFIVEIARATKFPGGIEFILNNLKSDAAAFSVIMIIGPIMLFLAILSSRKELLGW